MFTSQAKKYTYSKCEKNKEYRVIPPPNAVIHPLAMVVAPVNAIVTLTTGLATSEAECKILTRVHAPFCND